ncbi:hypothetical protein PoB_001933000 [Plakobranchus ocellatus]|uniref:Uncharacterized protein n=1 Tax=Plakobranchus ocellatus TaxID=259542 RepID=A0AAV3ZBB8_9GAST|nr:hypothetical protein PoB_001933000 [Plakobranchus ocellatus]
MKAADVCRMREAFLKESRRQNYVIPPNSSHTSVLEAIADLGEGDVIDESAVAIRASAVQESLTETNEQIRQICSQLKGQLFTKGFLIRVLSVLCGDSVEVTEARIADLGHQIAEINTSLLAVINVADEVFQMWTVCDQVTALGPPSQIPCSRQKGIVPTASINRTKRDTFCSPNTGKPKSSQCVDFDGHFTITEASRTNIRSRLQSSGFSVREAPLDQSHLSESVRTEDCLQAQTDNLSTKTGSIVGQSLPPGSTSDKYPDLSRRSQISGASESECARTQMIDEYKDDEDPYDNVISYKQHLDMFRRKKSNASKSDLDKSNALASRDNFAALTSKHDSPSNIPRHYEGTSNSPHLGRHFQMLKMTTGFDFVLDGNTAGDATKAIDVDRPNSGNGDSHVTVIPCYSKPDEAKNRMPANNDDEGSSERPDDHTSDHASPSPPSQGMANQEPSEAVQEQPHGFSDSDRSSDSQTEGTNSRQVAREASTASDTPPLPHTTSGSENALASASPTQSVVAGSSIEKAGPSAHAEAKASAQLDSSEAVSDTVSALLTVSGSAVETASTNEDQATVDSSANESVAVNNPGSASSICTSGSTQSMDPLPRHPPVPVRQAPPPPTPRSGGTPVPPPVAKKPTNRFGSWKKPSPEPPGVKPVVKSSLSSHADLSSAAATSKLDEVANGKRDNNNSVPKSISSPLLSKAPENVSGDRESVKGIAALFDFKTPAHEQTTVSDGARSGAIVLNAANKDKPSPPVPARKRVSGLYNNHNNDNNNDAENTQPQQSTSGLAVSAEVEKEGASSPRNNRVSCVTDAGSDIQTAVRQSMLAADAVVWPSGLNHPEIKSFIKAGDQKEALGRGVEGEGIGQLVERANASLVSIHNRLHRGGTEHTEEDVSHRNSVQTQQCAQGIHSEHATQPLASEDVGISTEKVDSKTPDETFSSTERLQSRMWSLDSNDTIVNESDDQKPKLDSSASFTSDPDVKDAIFSLDAIIQSEQVEDTLERNPSFRLSTASTSSVASTPRCSSLPSSPVTLRRDYDMLPDPGPATRKLSTPSYENWTINRAVTRPINSTPDCDTDEDDHIVVDDDFSEEGAASPCLMKRDGPAKSSNDSGLCEDSSLTSDSGQVSTAVSGSSGCAALTDFGAGGFADGRIKSLEVLQRMQQCADDDDDDDDDDDASEDIRSSLFLYPGELGDQDTDSICEYMTMCSFIVSN